MVKFFVECGQNSEPLTKQPTRNTGEDAGFDLYLPFKTDRFIDDFLHKNLDPLSYFIADDGIVVPPGKDVLIPLYVRSRFDSNLVLKITNKSGVATKQKFIHGADTIDHGYKGIWHAHIINFSDQHQKVEWGNKIIQAVPFLIDNTEHEVVVGGPGDIDKFYEGFETSRGEGGFGHQGLK